jgi:ubiquinone/menaquinone biosynthesis C-methylase UbiE
MEEDYVSTRRRFKLQDVAENYEKRRFGTLKGRFLKSREETIVRAMLDTIGGKKKIIDIPCGTGRLSGVLKEYADWLAGADFSEAMLQQSRKRGEYSELRQCEIEKMPYPDAYFDVVVCFRFIHHLAKQDRLKVFAEVWRVTKGHFIFTFNSKHSVAYVKSLILKNGYYSETMREIQGELEKLFFVRRISRVLPLVAGETVVLCEKREDGKSHRSGR